jgi:uncharacterized protein YydD (DUF2326 family)
LTIPIAGTTLQLMSNRKDDGNSEKALIKLIREILGGVVQRVDALETKQQERHDQIMTAIETLQEAVTANTAGQAALTSAVNDAITRIGTPSASDATLLSLAALVQSSTQSDADLTAALRTALGGEVTPPAA